MQNTRGLVLVALACGLVLGCARTGAAPAGAGQVQAPASTPAPAPAPAKAAFADLTAAPSADGFAALVFSKTEKFRHDSIPAGNTMLVELGRAHGFRVEVTEDANAFTDDNLRRFAVVVFHSTTGDVLNDAQQAAFERYIRADGAFVGVHAATCAEYDWPWYNRLVGAYFASHPHVQPARHDVVDGTHPSTRHLPPSFERTDEWYNFRQYNPDVTPLLTLDETSYHGGRMGGFHPIAWCHVFDGGRAWYTGGGHTQAAFAEPAFRRHVLGGIFWAAGRALPEPRVPDAPPGADG